MVGITHEPSNQRSFFGQTAQAAVASATPFKFPHGVICVNNPQRGSQKLWRCSQEKEHQQGPETKKMRGIAGHVQVFFVQVHYIVYVE